MPVPRQRVPRPTGINFEGPAPRPLERARIVLAEDGQILVDKARKFQRELGQWTDPEAFLKDRRIQIQDLRLKSEDVNPNLCNPLNPAICNAHQYG